MTSTNFSSVEKKKTWPLGRRLALALGALFALLLVTTISTLWTVKAQKADGLVINLAGRQRMLTQKYTKESLAWLNFRNILKGQECGFAKKTWLARGKSAELFETTLLALRNGGETFKSLDLSGPVQVPVTRNQKIVTQLDTVKGEWDLLAAQLDHLLKKSDGLDPVQIEKALGKVMRQSVITLKNMNAAVLMYQAGSEAGSALWPRFNMVRS